MHSDPNVFCRGMPGDFTEGQQDGVFWSTAAHPFVSNQKGWFAAAEQEVDKNAEPNWWCAPWQLWVYGASRHRDNTVWEPQGLALGSLSFSRMDLGRPGSSIIFLLIYLRSQTTSMPFYSSFLHCHQSTTGHKSPLPTRAELHTALCTQMRHLVLNNPLPTP